LHGSGSSDYQLGVTVTPMPPLAIPQVQVTNQPGSVRLTWNVVPNAQHYVVWRQIGSGAWVNLGTVNAGQTLQFVDTGAPINTNVTYGIRAYHGTAMSDYQRNVIGRALPAQGSMLAWSEHVGVASLAYSSLESPVLRQEQEGILESDLFPGWLVWEKSAVSEGFDLSLPANAFDVFVVDYEGIPNPLQRIERRK